MYGRCVLGKHEEECIVGMGTSNVDLTDCHMHGSQGPAVDISGKARLSMSRGSIKECVGKLCPVSIKNVFWYQTSC